MLSMIEGVAKYVHVNALKTNESKGIKACFEVDEDEEEEEEEETGVEIDDQMDIYDSSSCAMESGTLVYEDGPSALSGKTSKQPGLFASATLVSASSSTFGHGKLGFLPQHTTSSKSRVMECLSKKEKKDLDPTAREAKKKCVRFNMDLNETCEIVEPFSEESKSNVELFRTTTQSSSQVHRSRLAEDATKINDDAEHDLKISLNEDVSSLRMEKEHLLSELRTLHECHDKEMKQLRDEYHRRREDYYSELDAIQLEMHEKRSRYKCELLEYKDVIKLKERLDTYEDELKHVLENEEDLVRRRDKCREVEKEISDFEQYYERRHRELAVKKEDLNLWQGQLEELSRDLKVKDRDLRFKKERLDAHGEGFKSCCHDDQEIECTRSKLLTSSKEVEQLKKRIIERDEDIHSMNHKVDCLEDENCRLTKKLLWLESQVVLHLKQSHEPADLRKLGDTSAMAMTMGDQVEIGSSGKSTLMQAEGMVGSSHRSQPTIDDELLFRSKASHEAGAYEDIVFDSCDAPKEVNNNMQKTPFSFFFREELPAAPIAIEADDSDGPMEEAKASRSVISKACILL